MSTTAKLGEVAPAKPLRRSDISPEEMVWHLNLDQIEANSGRILEEIVAPIADANNSTHWFDERHVLYSKLRPYLNKVVVPDKHGIATTELVPMMPDPRRLDRKYLAHYLKSKKFVNWVSSQIAGAKMPRVSMKVFWEHEVPLPSLPEQKSITAILDKADAIRRKRQKAIDLADEFLRSVFLDMFGDPVTNPKGWKLKPIGETLTFLTSGSRGWAKYYSNDGILFLRIQNIGKNELILEDVAFVNPPESAEARRTRVIEGDVLLSITADLGRTAVIPNELPVAHINQHLAILRFKGVNPLYASAFIASPGGQEQFKKLNRGGVKAGLNFDDVRSIKMMLPPKQLQEKWAGIYKKKMQQDYLVKNASIWDTNLFNSLTQRAFRGEL